METYNGNVKTPADAIILFEACRLGLLPRVQRRLSEKERQLIKSGSVFVWDEREAGMRRWTDGKSWSASRVSGSFLTYREMEGKRGGNSFSAPTAQANGNGDRRHSQNDGDPHSGEPDGYRYKPDGLMKQSFSITTSQGQHLHLISYCSRSHTNNNTLPTPTTDPNLRNIRPQKGMYPESTIHDAQNMPAVTRSPMVGSPYGSSPRGPHSQNYLRHSPHAQYGSAWPPSPMHTMSHASSPYSGYQPQPSPLGGGQQSPVYYGRHPPPQGGVRGPTMFDRAPPPLRNSTLPPAPPAQPVSAGLQQTSPYHAPPPTFSPQYSTNQYPNHNSQPPSNGASSYSSYQPQYNNNSSHRSPTESHHPNDPRMEQQHYEPNHNNRYQPSPPLAPPYHPQDTRPPENGRPPSKTIPSIGSLINRTPSPPRPAERRPGDGGPRNSSHQTNGLGIAGANHGQEPSSRPPPNAHVPSLGYSEDQKALKQLDRAFAP